MSALSDIEIRLGRSSGDIVIHPFNLDNLGSASYDVRLGEFFYETNSKDLEDLPLFYNLYDQRDVGRVWKGPWLACRAERYKRWWWKSAWTNISDDDQVIMLKPRGNLLCHTQEFIGARCNATTMMKARSSIGRSLVNVCQCAGMGDVGFFNRWTMEVYNRSNYYIPLVVGRRIAQIVFLQTGLTEKTYLSKYQDSNDLKVLIDSWTPDMMLPRLYADRDILKGEEDARPNDNDIRRIKDQ